ncbi:hypothetical protein ATO6_01050 [Oceanicola sp. 22II-s10i]|uniref:response regulator transcription factor n=1 Tax=Oceanicola sp. 22II-s10i TaxID=1317116 RepID=UPI000B51E95C|nr:response regulator transcription factor [Oceanicola sp. 22II-s10i]OWU85561.1 hypothetical protein ATO6_01050 [Oceanicola sp. 22II-s10i]
MRILISDATWTSATLAHQLRGQGFYVSEAATGEDILTYAAQGRYDAILIDPDLPDTTAQSLLRHLRGAHPHMPVCLFARSWSHEATARALTAGADDVIPFPYDAPAIAARLRAYARRAQGFASQTLTHGGLTVELDGMAVRYAGQALHLTRLEYELVEMLALADGRLVTREAIMTKLYAWEDEPDPKIIDVYICRIRSKLAACGAPGDVLLTTFGQGYRVNAAAVPMRRAA